MCECVYGWPRQVVRQHSSPVTSSASRRWQNFVQAGKDLYDAWARGKRMGYRHTTGVGPEPRRIVENPFSPYFPHFFWNRTSPQFEIGHQHLLKSMSDFESDVSFCETSDFRLDVETRRCLTIQNLYPTRISSPRKKYFDVGACHLDRSWKSYGTETIPKYRFFVKQSFFLKQSHAHGLVTYVRVLSDGHPKTQI